MNVIFQLPRDILHSVYGEWLEWEDLSRLDLACVEKSEREVWLTSLTDLRMSRKEEYDSLWGDKMTVFYKWLGSRKVFLVESFPLRLSVLDDLPVVLDMKSYCPSLRSIVIERGGGFHLPNRSQLESILSMFFSYCHHLTDITVCIIEEGLLLCEALSEIILGALEEDFRENSLVRFCLKGTHTYDRNQEVIARLLIKHASSLEALYVRMNDGMALISTTLIEYGIHLRALNVHLGGNPLEPTLPWLLLYLSSAGRLLESLKVECWGTSFNFYDALVPAASLCPKLTTLDVHDTYPCRMESAYELLTQCPNLRNVSINRTIFTNDKDSTVHIDVRSGDKVWLPCLSFALARSRPKRVILVLGDEPDGRSSLADLKSLLEPYQIELESSTSEASLIVLLRNLPHLNRLLLEPDSHEESFYSDATLSAITEHARSLTRLDLYFSYLDIFSDSCLRDLIERCEMLDSASITCCGLDSLMALSRHSSLREIEIIMAPSVSEEMLDILLLDEEVNSRWSSSLEGGSMELYGDEYGIKYEFNEDSRRWMKNEGD